MKTSRKESYTKKYDVVMLMFIVDEGCINTYMGLFVQHPTDCD